jgi:hypothetical protein
MGRNRRRRERARESAAFRLVVNREILVIQLT